jgi:hypothetical protein
MPIGTPVQQTAKYIGAIGSGMAADSVGTLVSPANSETARIGTAVGLAAGGIVAAVLTRDTVSALAEGVGVGSLGYLGGKVSGQVRAALGEGGTSAPARPRTSGTSAQNVRNVRSINSAPSQDQESSKEPRASISL